MTTVSLNSIRYMLKAFKKKMDHLVAMNGVKLILGSVTAHYLA